MRRPSPWPISPVLLAALLLCLPAWAGAEGPTSARDLDAFLSPIVPKAMAELRVPGSVIVVVKDGRVLFAKGYGVADLETGAPIVPDRTRFRIGSVSKLFVATAVMQLHERGLLRLTDDVNRHLTLFRLDPTYPEPVRVAHLLTHTGGFYEPHIGLLVRHPSEVLPLGQFLPARMPPRVMPPGVAISYSTYGMALAGHLVEVVTGLPFARYAEENILGPLGMRRSSFVMPPEGAADVATGYELRHGRLRPAPSGYFQLLPSGALTATAADMARFMMAHLAQGRYGAARILAEETAREMHRRQFTNDPRLPGFAYGFYERFENGLRALAHGGVWRGFYTFLILVPDRNVGVFISSTRAEPRFAEEVVRRFFDRYYPALGPAAPAGPPLDFAARADGFAGWYRDIGYARHDVEKLNSLFTQLHVTAEDGALAVVYPDESEDRDRWEEVAPLVFRRAGGEDPGVFRRDERGRVSHVLIRNRVYERVPWVEALPFQLGLAGAFALVFLWGCVRWAVRGLRRSRAGASWAVTLAGLISGLNLIFLIGLALVFFWIEPLDFLYGLPGGVTAVLLIPLVTTGLTGGLLALAALAWARRRGSLLERVHASVIGVAAVGFAGLLLFWNLLGPRA